MTEGPPPPLAIASCGNAALAAAVVAAAGRRRLLVFVPDRRRAGRARRGCGRSEPRSRSAERQEGVAGDPTYHRLQAAIADGALPFTCQGNENGLAIEGGETLGYEMADALGAERGSRPRRDPGRRRAPSQCRRSGPVRGGGLRRPGGHAAVHTVQTAGAWPLARALEKLAARLPADPAPRSSRAAAVRRRAPLRVHVALGDACPTAWPTASSTTRPTTGWRSSRRCSRTGGKALVVNEDEIAQANELGAEATGIEVDPTGSAGLAGLAQLCRRGDDRCRASGRPCCSPGARR